MKKTVYSWYVLLFSTMSIGCASKISIQSDPPQAEVYLAIEGQLEKQKVGLSPIELTETQIVELLKLSPETSSWVEVTVSKQDFQTKTLYMPSSRLGELSRIIKVKLNPMEDASSQVVKIMRMFFNAKKFAETKQYEQAHSEIDKVIAIDSKIPQAYSMKAGIYFLQSNFDLASQYYSKALELDPSFTEAIQMMDKIKNKTGGN